MLRATQVGSSKDALLHVSIPSLRPRIEPLLPSCGRIEVGTGSFTIVMALKTPKGFGPPAPKSSGPKPLSEEQKDTRLSKTKRRQQEPSDDFEDEGEEDEDDEIPQIVMDRMIKRIGVSLTVPLILGVSSFAMFWYLRVVLKFDIPEWLPLLVSGTFFGSSALGISYGILSTSWDPNRDGSFLGWKEAKANWPIFFDNLQGKQGRR